MIKNKYRGVEQWQLVGLNSAKLTIGYGSEIHLVETGKRQRKPRSANYRNAWELILQRAVYQETDIRTPVKFGEASGGVIPSQALIVEKTSEKV